MKTTTSLDLAAACPAVTANDNSDAGLRGARVVLFGGPMDLDGTVARVERNRWGVAFLIEIDGGGEEWVSRIEPRGTRGAGCTLA